MHLASPIKVARFNESDPPDTDTKAIQTLFVPLAYSSETFTCFSDTIGQIKLIVLSSRIRLRYLVHFEQSDRIIYLDNNLYPFYAFLLAHILEQYLDLKTSQN